MEVKAKIVMLKGEKGDAGTSGDYSELNNKPQINGVTVNGNVSADDLGLASSNELDEAIAGVENSTVYLRLLGANEFEYTSTLMEEKVDEVVNRKIDDNTASVNGLYSSSKTQALVNSLGSTIRKSVNRSGSTAEIINSREISNDYYLFTHKLSGRINFNENTQTVPSFGDTPHVDINVIISGLSSTKQNMIMAVSTSNTADARGFDYDIIITLGGYRTTVNNLNDATITIDYMAKGKKV